MCSVKGDIEGMKLYSDIVEKYADYIQNNFLIADDVMMKDGVACGDYVTILGELDDGIMEFKIGVEGCKLCKAAANYLYEKYNNKDINYIIDETSALIRKIKDNQGILLDMFEVSELQNRFQCLYSPFEMLNAFAIQLKNKTVEIFEKEDTLGQLDCDACVVTGSVNWTGKENNVKKRPEEPVYPTEYKKNWGRVAKAYINDDEVQLLKKLYRDMTDEDFEYIRHGKMAQMIYSNLIKNQVDISSNPVWKNIIYQIHRKYIVQGEVERINTFISDNNLKIYSVKGGYNNELYTGKDVRVHLDYDYIAMSNRDAFYFANHLFANGYTIASGIFSLKKIEMDGRTMYSGHYHVRKIFNSQYKLVVDVNFPGFPMGRIDLFFPTISDGHITDEDQLIVTLCHAFKHKNVYMKDINDIYLMVKKRKLDYSAIKKRIDENKLQDYASILFAYIFQNYDLNDEIKGKLTKELDLDLELIVQKENWPFDGDEALEVKKNDLNERLKSGVDNQRLYLFPLAIFKKFQELNEEDINLIREQGYDIELLDENICRINIEGIKFVLLGIGIFMDTYSNVSNLGRKRIRCIVTEILDLIDAGDIHDIPYELDEMKVWYF